MPVPSMISRTEPKAWWKRLEKAKAAEYRQLAKAFAARWVKEADDGDHAPGAGDQPLEGAPVLLDELRLEQEVFGGVSGDGQLRNGDQIGPERPGALEVT